MTGNIIQPLSQPQFKVIGDDYILLWANEQIQAQISMLNQDKSSVTGELWIKRTNTNTDGHLHRATFNFNGPDTRQRLARTLTERFHDFDWGALLEQVCYYTLEEYRKPTAVMDPRDTAPTDLEWQIENFVALRGITSIFGDSGSTKSINALDACLHVAANQQWHGLSVKQTPVLYLDFERTYSTFVRRYYSLLNGLHWTVKPEVKYLKCDKPLFEMASDIRKIIANNGIGMVVVDSAGYASGDDPESANSALRLYRSIRTFNTTTIALDHQSKTENGSKSPFGSAYKRASVDMLWHIRSVGKEGENIVHVGLFHNKHNDIGKLEPMGLKLEFQKDEISIEVEHVEDNPELSKELSVGARIKGVLSDGPLPEDEIIKNLDVNEHTVHAALYRGKKDLFSYDKTSKEWSLKGYSND